MAARRGGRGVARGLALVLAWTAVPAGAADLIWSSRAGGSIGTYNRDVAVKAGLGQAFARPSEVGQPQVAFGGQFAARATGERFYSDIAIDLLSTQADGSHRERSELTTSLGYYLSDHWSLFAGYRLGVAGNGLFDDSAFHENGFYTGIGVAGLEADALVLALSTAYNFSLLNSSGRFDTDRTDSATGTTYHFETDETFSYPGLSIKLAAYLHDRPRHVLQLRYQRFNGVSKGAVEAVNADASVQRAPYRIEFTETYTQLSYLYFFDW